MLRVCIWCRKITHYTSSWNGKFARSLACLFVYLAKQQRPNEHRHSRKVRKNEKKCDIFSAHSKMNNICAKEIDCQCVVCRQITTPSPPPPTTATIKMSLNHTHVHMCMSTNVNEIKLTFSNRNNDQRNCSFGNSGGNNNNNNKWRRWQCAYSWKMTGNSRQFHTHVYRLYSVLHIPLCDTLSLMENCRLFFVSVYITACTLYIVCERLSTVNKWLSHFCHKFDHTIHTSHFTHRWLNVFSLSLARSTIGIPREERKIAHWNRNRNVWMNDDDVINATLNPI